MNDPVYGQLRPKKTQETFQRDKSRTLPKTASATNFSAASGASPSSGTPRGTGDTRQRFRRPELPCLMCGQCHRLWYCEAFKNMKPNQRRLDFVKQHKLCENCLLGNHETSNCRKNSVCIVNGCGKKHTKFVHVDEYFNDNENVKVNDEVAKIEVASASANVEVANNSVFTGPQVYMPIIEVVVNNTYNTSALLDTASTNSFCTQRMVDSLKIRGKSHNFNITTLNGQKSQSSDIIIFDVKSMDGSDTLTLLNVCVLTDIPAQMSQNNLDIDRYPHLQVINLPNTEPIVKVDILIGQDNSEALIPLEVRKGKPNEPFAVRTLFGLCINGSIHPVTPCRQILSNFVSTKALNEIEEQVDCVDCRLWSLENKLDVEHGRCMSQEDKQVLDLWESSIRLHEGHYELPIPWRNPGAIIPNNYSVAKYRLDSLKKSLVKKELFNRYDAEVEKMLTS